MARKRNYNSASNRRRRSRRRRNRRYRSTMRTALRHNAGQDHIRVSATRRFLVVPQQFQRTSTGYLATVKSWLERLQWWATLVANVLTVVLAAVSNDRAIPANASEMAIVGFTQSIFLSPADLCSESGLFSRPYKRESAWMIGTTFVSARVVQIVVTIIPNPDLSVRGGNYAVALVPWDLTRDKDSWGDYVNLMCSDICRLPNSAFSPTSRSTTVRYRPRRREFRPMDTATIKVNGADEIVNFPWTAVLVFHYTDMATTDAPKVASPSTTYTIPHSLFDIHITSEVMFRSPVTKNESCVASPFYYESKSMRVDSFGRQKDVEFSKVHVTTDGRYYFIDENHVSLEDLEMPSPV